MCSFSSLAGAPRWPGHKVAPENYEPLSIMGDPKMRDTHGPPGGTYPTNLVLGKVMALEQKAEASQK